MRGLEEIKKINETPNGFHGDSNEQEQFRPSQRLDREHRAQHPTLQKILEEITGGQPKTQTAGELLMAAHAGKLRVKPGHEESAAKLLAENDAPNIKEMLAVATVFEMLGLEAPDDYQEAKALAVILAAKSINVLDKIIGDKPKTLADRSRRNDKGDFLGMDGIHAAVGETSGFMRFWAGLNEHLGHEARYKEAKLSYDGGETPVGTLTFVGKEWDGLRAVPAKTYEGKKTYHGQFSSVEPEGNTMWNVVANTDEQPISYANAEAALHGARHARIHFKQAALNKARSDIG